MQRGFTLIECLVALFIVAVVLASASRAIGVIISDVHDSFVREVATWVAENEYNTYTISGQYPPVGVQKKSITMAGVKFNVVETISNTPNPYFRKIEIAISETSTPNYAIFKTINFISQY
jgi:general secretion pathway protein I